MIELKKKWDWKKREVRYYVNKSWIGRLMMKLYNEFEELIWLGICVGILVIVVNSLIL